MIVAASSIAEIGATLSAGERQWFERMLTAWGKRDGDSIELSDQCAARICRILHLQGGPLHCCLNRPRGLGDVVAKVATPIARVIGMNCIDPATRQLKPDSGCSKRQRMLNDLAPFTTPLPAKAYEPGLTLITPTKNRPEAFALLEKWMARQTVRWDQWLVVTDGVPPALTLGQQLVRRHAETGGSERGNMRAGFPLVARDRLLIIHDDDWYAPSYIERMLALLAKADLVGLARNWLYAPREMRWGQWSTLQKHWCVYGQTAFTAAVYPTAFAACQRRHIDVDTWQRWAGKKRLDDTADVLRVAMRGMPGPRNTGVKVSVCKCADPDGAKLREWIGDDARDYLVAGKFGWDASTGKRPA